MKKASFILTILLVWVFSACAQQKSNVTPSQNRVGYSAFQLNTIPNGIFDGNLRKD